MFSNLLSQLPLYLLSLPMVLLALSVHETAHGYAAYKLGDPTARSLGRLTLNPLKHIDPIGFICMLLFHFGWAKPVPINTRYFKKPRLGMAITAAAGPISNILLAVILAGLLRLEVLLADVLCSEDIVTFIMGGTEISAVFKIFSALAYMLYIGIILNLGLAVFNMLPFPPLDGSRIFYLFLPVNWYFTVMKYERYIMIALLVALWIFPGTWLSGISNWLSGLVLNIFGFWDSSVALGELNVMVYYISSALSL